VKRRLVAMLGAGFGAAIGGATLCRGVLAADDPAPLKPGAGEDVTSAQCSACHSSDYIVMNSSFLTADGWKAEVTKMRTAFGAPIDDSTAAEIVSYLASNYGAAAKPSAPAPSRNDSVRQ
jgi:mono/diheme cytochrome c family protein